MALSPDEVAELLLNYASVAVIQHINAQPTETLAELYSELVKDLYWKVKDLSATVTVARAGIQKLLDVADQFGDSDPDAADKFKGTAKGIAYNLASFTWPGWDEPGMDCTPFLSIGLDAAHANFRLGSELSRGELPMSRAHWMLGAQLMAAGKWIEAQKEFAKGALLAASAAAPTEELAGYGFACLAFHLSDIDANDKNKMEEVISQLTALDGGAEAARQVETAWAVFQPTK